MKITKGYSIDGIAVEKIDSERMHQYFSDSGFTGVFFKEVDFLYEKDGKLVFKNMTDCDDIFIGLVFIDIESGLADFWGTEIGVAFDLDQEDEALEFYRNFKGIK